MLLCAIQFASNESTIGSHNGEYNIMRILLLLLFFTAILSAFF